MTSQPKIALLRHNVRSIPHLPLFVICMAFKEQKMHYVVPASINSPEKKCPFFKFDELRYFMPCSCLIHTPINIKYKYSNLTIGLKLLLACTALDIYPTTYLLFETKIFSGLSVHLF